MKNMFLGWSKTVTKRLVLISIIVVLLIGWNLSQQHRFDVSNYVGNGKIERIGNILIPGYKIVLGEVLLNQSISKTFTIEALPPTSGQVSLGLFPYTGQAGLFRESSAILGIAVTNDNGEAIFNCMDELNRWTTSVGNGLFVYYRNDTCNTKFYLDENQGYPLKVQVTVSDPDELLPFKTEVHLVSGGTK